MPPLLGYSSHLGSGLVAFCCICIALDLNPQWQWYTNHNKNNWTLSMHDHTWSKLMLTFLLRGSSSMALTYQKTHLDLQRQCCAQGYPPSKQWKWDVIPGISGSGVWPLTKFTQVMTMRQRICEGTDEWSRIQALNSGCVNSHSCSSYLAQARKKESGHQTHSFL